jgi:hypothetical protein
MVKKRDASHSRSWDDFPTWVCEQTMLDRAIWGAPGGTLQAT